MEGKAETVRRGWVTLFVAKLTIYAAIIVAVWLWKKGGVLDLSPILFLLVGVVMFLDGVEEVISRKKVPAVLNFSIGALAFIAAAIKFWKS